MLRARLRVCLCVCSLVFMALGTPSCPSLTIVPSISNQQQLLPDCQALNNCSGLSCFNAQRDRLVVFVVENCKDPVNVNVTITDGSNATVLMRSFNKSIILSMNESYRFNWTMRRNASHLLVKVSFIYTFKSNHKNFFYLQRRLYLILEYFIR